MTDCTMVLSDSDKRIAGYRQAAWTSTTLLIPNKRFGFDLQAVSTSVLSVRQVL